MFRSVPVIVPCADLANIHTYTSCTDVGSLIDIVFIAKRILLYVRIIGTEKGPGSGTEGDHRVLTVILVGLIPEG